MLGELHKIFRLQISPSTQIKFYFAGEYVRQTFQQNTLQHLNEPELPVLSMSAQKSQLKWLLEGDIQTIPSKTWVPFGSFL